MELVQVACSRAINKNIPSGWLRALPSRGCGLSCHQASHGQGTGHLGVELLLDSAFGQDQEAELGPPPSGRVRSFCRVLWPVLRNRRGSWETTDSCCLSSHLSRQGRSTAGRAHLSALLPRVHRHLAGEKQVPLPTEQGGCRTSHSFPPPYLLTCAAWVPGGVRVTVPHTDGTR